MPNWCQNALIIPKKKFSQFSRRFTKHNHNLLEAYGYEYELCFNKIIQMPKEVAYTMQPSPVHHHLAKENWYNWAIENWGSKATYAPLYIDRNYDRYNIKICFDLPWNPISLAALEVISKKLNCKVIHYFLEEGNMYFGKRESEPDSDDEFHYTSSDEVSEDDCFIFFYGKTKEELYLGEEDPDNFYSW